LLIAPNPESSLNEEAGRLLLEKYEDYAKHARLFTDIHARVTRSQPEETEPVVADSTVPVPTNPTKKRSAGSRNKKQGEKKTDQKKKSLKRL